MARFRRLARDYERLPETLAGLHFLAFAMLMLKRFIPFHGPKCITGSRHQEASTAESYSSERTACDRTLQRRKGDADGRIQKYQVCH